MLLSLVTPDSGLLFWMLLIFGIVFLILSKWGFPLITNMVDKRNEEITKALDLAEQAKNRIDQIEQEQAKLIENAKKEQLSILQVASQTKKEIIESAKQEASIQAQHILEKAKQDIEAERQHTMANIKAEVADIAIDMAEKIIRKEFEDKQKHKEYIESILAKLNKEN